MENAALTFRAADSHIPQNEVYERDYAREFKSRVRISPGKDFLDTLQEIGFFQACKEEMDKIPKRIVPKLKADHEYLLGSVTPMCGSLAGESGRGGLRKLAGGD